MSIRLPLKTLTASLLLSLSLASHAQFSGNNSTNPTAATATRAVKPLDCLSRDCLLKLADDYFTALVAHDPKRLPFATNVFFVENAYKKPIGDGLWHTASKAPTNFKVYVPDAISKQVGFIGMMEEDGKPIQIGLRLKVEDGMITEVEHVLARNLRDTSLPNLQTPRPGINAEIPLNQRMKRYEMIGIAYSYYDALVLDDGNLAPFAKDCERHENGMITVRPKPDVMPERAPGAKPNYTLFGCAGQLSTGVMGYIDDLDNRRVEVADPITGLVMGFSHFRHSMKKDTFPIYGVEGVTENPMKFNPFDLPAAHVFKIRDGEIHEIEAMGFTAPYMSATGWEGRN